MLKKYHSTAILIALLIIGSAIVGAFLVYLIHPLVGVLGFLLVIASVMTITALTSRESQQQFPYTSEGIGLEIESKINSRLSNLYKRVKDSGFNLFAPEEAVNWMLASPNIEEVWFFLENPIDDRNPAIFNSVVELLLRDVKLKYWIGSKKGDKRFISLIKNLAKDPKLANVQWITPQVIVNQNLTDNFKYLIDFVNIIIINPLPKQEPKICFLTFRNDNDETALAVNLPPEQSRSVIDMVSRAAFEGTVPDHITMKKAYQTVMNVEHVSATKVNDLGDTIEDLSRMKENELLEYLKKYTPKRMD